MSISNNEIDILYSFFDQIIPSSDDMPCATEAIDKKELFDNEDRLGKITDYIIDHHNSKTKNK